MIDYFWLTTITFSYMNINFVRIFSLYASAFSFILRRIIKFFKMISNSFCKTLYIKLLYLLLIWRWLLRSDFLFLIYKTILITSLFFFQSRDDEKSTLKLTVFSALVSLNLVCGFRIPLTTLFFTILFLSNRFIWFRRN